MIHPGMMPLSSTLTKREQFIYDAVTTDKFFFVSTLSAKVKWPTPSVSVALQRLRERGLAESANLMDVLPTDLEIQSTTNHHGRLVWRVIKPSS